MSDKSSSAPYAATWAGIGCLALFLALTIVVSSRILWNADLSVMYSLRGPDIDALVAWATVNGIVFAGEASVVLSLVLTLLLWRFGARIWSLAPTAFLLATAIEAVLKRSIAQPVEPLRQFHRGYFYPFGSYDLGGAFPSGHASRSWFFITFLAVWLWYRYRSHRVAVVTACAVLATAISLSRVYIGDHWPTDVVGGALLGGGIALLVAPPALRRVEAKGGRRSRK